MGMLLTFVARSRFANFILFVANFRQILDKLVTKLYEARCVWFGSIQLMQWHSFDINSEPNINRIKWFHVCWLLERSGAQQLVRIAFNANWDLCFGCFWMWTDIIHVTANHESCINKYKSSSHSRYTEHSHEGEFYSVRKRKKPISPLYYKLNGCAH